MVAASVVDGGDITDVSGRMSQTSEGDFRHHRVAQGVAHIISCSHWTSCCHCTSNHKLIRTLKCLFRLEMNMIRLLLTSILLGAASAFAPIVPMTPTSTKVTSLNMVDMSSVHDIASTGLLLAETEPWVQPLSLVLDPFLNLLSFAMVSLLS